MAVNFFKYDISDSSSAKTSNVLYKPLESKQTVYAKYFETSPVSLLILWELPMPKIRQFLLLGFTTHGIPPIFANIANAKLEVDHFKEFRSPNLR